MRPRWKKWLIEVLKVLIIVGCFAIVQNQIIALRSEISGSSGRFAEALEQYQGEFSKVSDTFQGAILDSKNHLSYIQEDLKKSASLLKDEKSNFTQLINHRNDKLYNSLGFEFVRYKGTLEEVLDQSKKNGLRLLDVEEKVDHVIPSNSEDLEKAIVYPIAQIKGEGTVGSGVMIYSQPRKKSEKPGEKIKDSHKSGAITHETFVLTACHVVMEILGSEFPSGTLSSIHILDKNDPPKMSVFSAKVEIYDEAQDLALLRIMSNKKFIHVAHILPGNDVPKLQLFSRIYAVGCPLGNNPLPSYGEISSKGKKVGDQNFWMINAPTFFGNSGGGIFQVESGKLIGISSMIYTYGKSRPVVVPHMGLFVPIDQVEAWLKSSDFGYILNQDTPGSDS